MARVKEIRKKYEHNRVGEILEKDKFLDKKENGNSKKRKEMERGEARPEESPARRKKVEKERNPLNPLIPLAAGTYQEKWSIEALSPMFKNNYLGEHAVPGEGAQHHHHLAGHAVAGGEDHHQHAGHAARLAQLRGGVLTECGAVCLKAACRTRNCTGEHAGDRRGNHASE